VGEHLKKKRLDLGLRQKDVAREVGVSQKTYEYWEGGRTVEPDIRHYPAIIRFLGYDPAQPDPTLYIGERLRAVRRARGLSRKKLAKQLGVDESTLWKWEERGEQGRPARKVLRVVEKFLREE
jgi:transcriptional regulator with XRE-family HTH domain